MATRIGACARIARRPVSVLLVRGRSLWHWATTVLVATVLSAPALASQVPPGVGPPASEYAFQSGAGLLVFHVRPERAADFEAILTRISEVLAASVDPVRQRQAASWRMFRSTEASRDAALYVFFFDPAEPGADYDPVRVLSDAVPADAQQYYERLRAAVIKIERMGLARIR